MVAYDVADSGDEWSHVLVVELVGEIGEHTEEVTSMNGIVSASSTIARMRSPAAASRIQARTPSAFMK
jgi:hypothetical protein